MEPKHKTYKFIFIENFIQHYLLNIFNNYFILLFIFSRILCQRKLLIVGTIGLTIEKQHTSMYMLELNS